MEKIREKYDKHVVASSYLVLAPQIIGLIVFSIYPVFWVIRYSVYHYDGITASFAGLENFIRIFTRDSGYWMSILNTFIIAYGKLIIEIPLSLMAAMLLSKKVLKCKKLFSVGFYMPNVLGIAVSAMIFTFLFSSFNGIINNFLIFAGIIKEPHNWFSDKWSAMTVICTHSIWVGFSTNMLFFMAGFQNIPDDLYEAAEIDGASKIKQFFKITIPMIAPTLRIILMLAMVNGMKMTNNVLLLTNGGPAGKTNVVMLYIYKAFFETGAKAQYGYASAMGVVTSVIVAIVTLAYLRISKKSANVY